MSNAAAQYFTWNTKFVQSRKCRLFNYGKLILKEKEDIP